MIARRVQPLLVPLVVLLAWQATAAWEVLPAYLSSPTAIVSAIVGLAPELGWDLVVSVFRAYAGFAIGAGLGVLLGLWAGRSRAVANFFDPLVAFLYPVPKIAFLPVLLLLLGLGHASMIAMIALAVFFPVFIAAQLGVASVNPVHVWSARNMGAGPLGVFFRVVVPGAAPLLFGGLRVGLGHSFVILFAAELIGGNAGLGYFISEGEQSVRFDMMFAGIFCFAAIGLASDRLFMHVRRRLLRGQTLGTEEPPR